MSRSSDSGSRRVYSTDRGRLCPECGAATTQCRCRGAARRGAPTEGSTPRDGVVRIRRESKGRGGKSVTVVDGVPADSEALRALARELKQHCGVGGAVKSGCIELQGDQRNAVKPLLEQKGYQVKLAGG